jgi:heme oxygenase
MFTCPNGIYTHVCIMPPYNQLTVSVSLPCPDLEYYYGKEQVPDLVASEKITPAVREYIDAMEAACEKNPALLIAHSYSRYLGDLSGM